MKTNKEFHEKNEQSPFKFNLNQFLKAINKEGTIDHFRKYTLEDIVYLHSESNYTYIFLLDGKKKMPFKKHRDAG